MALDLPRGLGVNRDRLSLAPGDSAKSRHTLTAHAWIETLERAVFHERQPFSSWA
jgi:hypothetical protein